jgi:hypothetical protein
MAFTVSLVRCQGFIKMELKKEVVEPSLTVEENLQRLLASKSFKAYKANINAFGLDAGVYQSLPP